LEQESEFGGQKQIFLNQLGMLALFRSGTHRKTSSELFMSMKLKYVIRQVATDQVGSKNKRL
jgi:hypothetical protein